jgi:hypothetical protein
MDGQQTLAHAPLRPALQGGLDFPSRLLDLIWTHLPLGVPMAVIKEKGLQPPLTKLPEPTSDAAFGGSGGARGLRAAVPIQHGNEGDKALSYPLLLDARENGVHLFSGDSQ